MIRRWTTILLCLILVVSFSACGNKKPANDSTNTEKESSEPTPTLEPTTAPEVKKLSVSVSFDAMKELVAAVGKDKVEIVTVIPAGTETHDFEPKAQDLVNLSVADIFVYNGLGMEGWVEEAIAAANNTDLIVIEASKGADVIENETSDDDHDDDGHSHGKYDPHLWLSLKGAQTMVTNIKDALIQADPSNKEYYEQNHNEFVAQLEALYQEYSEKFQSVEEKNFVTGHAAFGYLCRDFGLEQNSIRNMFAEGEPSAKQLTELVEYCREHNVTTIFSEEMVSAEVSQTLANEVGAKVEIIYTMENPQDGMTYLERMESNLSKIYASLTN